MITQHTDMIECNFERIPLRTDNICKLLNIITLQFYKAKCNCKKLTLLADRT